MSTQVPLLLLQRDELAIPAEQAGAAVASGTWVLLQDPDSYGAALANSIASELRLLGHPSSLQRRRATSPWSNRTTTCWTFVQRSTALRC